MLTEIGARFAMGSTTFRESIDDRMEGIEARADSGYSVGAYGTLWRRGWLRLQAELLYSVRHAILAETSGRFLVSRYSLTYVELPVLTRLDIPLSGRVQPFAKLGVVPGVLVGARHSLVGDVPGGVLNRPELGVVFAAGARVPLSRSWDLTFELRGMHGVSDTFVRTPRRSSAVVAGVGIGYQRGSRPDASSALDIDTRDTLRWHARRAPARDVERPPPRDVETAPPRHTDPFDDLPHAFVQVREHAHDERCLEWLEAGDPARAAGVAPCVQGAVEARKRAHAAQAGALAIVSPGVPMSPAPAQAACHGALPELVAGDTIDQVIIVADAHELHVHMKKGGVYCYPLLGIESIPPAGDTYRGTKSGRLLTVTSTGTKPREPLVLQGPLHDAWAKRIRARGSFRIIVIDSHAPVTGIGQALAAGGVSRQAADRVTGTGAGGARLTVKEARSVLDASGRSATDNQSELLPLDKEAHRAWLRRHGGKRNAFVGSPDRDTLLPQAVARIMAQSKQQAGITDPPMVSAHDLQQEATSDPALRASWLRLEPWERALWEEIWQRRPGSTVEGRRKDLSLTQAVRFRIALQMSADHVPEGMREAARAMFNDPVFQATVAASITLYVVLLVNPDVTLSKVIVAGVTAALLTVFTASEIYNLATAWFDLRAGAGKARTLAELDAAARRFGQAVGGSGLRVLVALFTYFAGKALPAARPGPTTPPTPTAPAVATSGGPAAVVVRARVRGIELAILDDATVVMPLHASNLLSSTGAGSTGSTSSGGRSGTIETKSETAVSKATNKDATADGNRQATQARPDSKASTNQQTIAPMKGAKITTKGGKGFTIPKAAEAKIPRDWGPGVPNKKKVGMRWQRPGSKGGDSVRIDQGDPSSPFPSQQVDHVRVNSGGKVIGPDGKPITGVPSPKDTAEAHIPLSVWLRWKTWNSP